MLSLIDRYILKRYLFTVSGILIMFVPIGILASLAEKVGKIIDIRVRMDLVIMLDRGGQRFKARRANVERHRNGWFNHSATHDPDYWNDHDLWGRV